MKIHFAISWEDIKTQNTNPVLRVELIGLKTKAPCNILYLGFIKVVVTQ